MKVLGIGAVILASAVLAGCGGEDGVGGDAASPPFVQAAASAAPDAANARDGITVVGLGTVETRPDIVGWSFGVRTRAETAEAALGDANEAMERLLAALRDAGVEGDDLRTEQVSLYPETREDGSGGGITGYTAETRVHATVRDVDRAGAVVDAAVTAGANEVYGPQLRVEDARAQYGRAVRAAYEDARARGEAIAEQAGVGLGAPVAVLEGGPGGGEPAYDVAAGELAERTAIEPGIQSVTATVTVTFAIA